MDAAADIAWTSFASVDSIRGWRKVVHQRIPQHAARRSDRRHGAHAGVPRLRRGRCVIASRLKMNRAITDGAVAQS